MDASRRAELVERRRALQREIARGRALAGFSEILAGLEGDEPGSWGIVWREEDSSVWDWRDGGFPWTNYGPVDWGQVPGAVVGRWRGVEDLERVVGEFRGAVVYCIAGPEFALRVRLGRFLELVGTRVWVLDDLHVACPEAGWLLETYHEGDLGFGRWMDLRAQRR